MIAAQASTSSGMEACANVSACQLTDFSRAQLQVSMRQTDFIRRQPREAAAADG
jgi:hypothetical protein